MGSTHARKKITKTITTYNHTVEVLLGGSLFHWVIPYVTIKCGMMLCCRSYILIPNGRNTNIVFKFKNNVHIDI